MAAPAFPIASRFDEAILRALESSSEAVTNDVIDSMVARELGLTVEMLTKRHDPNKGARTEFAYRMAWARTRLKAKGLIERVGSKAWRLCRDQEHG